MLSGFRENGYKNADFLYHSQIELTVISRYDYL